MNNEKFGGEATFNKVMAEAQLLEDVSFVEDGKINLKSADILVHKLTEILKGDFTVLEPHETVNGIIDSAVDKIIDLKALETQFPQGPVLEKIKATLKELEKVKKEFYEEVE